MSKAGRVVVVGAGISGLVARRLSETFDVTVLEATACSGGKIATIDFRGHRLDVGADAFITRNAAAVELCRELGLGDLLIAPAAASTVAVFARGSLRLLPRGLAIGIPTDLFALARSGVVSAKGSTRALRDFFGKKPCAPADYSQQARAGLLDPTVAELVGARLGEEVLRVLVDPLIGGINAGSVDTLSFAAALPQLVEKVAGSTSLMRALSSFIGAPGTPVGERPALFNGLSTGLATLVEHLVSACERRGVEICTEVAVRALETTSGGLQRPRWTLRCENGALVADAVVLAVPADAASALLREVAPDLSDELAAIPYAGVATVTGAWPAEALRNELQDVTTSRRAIRQGTRPALWQCAGVLVPRDSAHLITAVSFTSAKWPHSAGANEIVLRASVGHHGDERWAAMDDESLVQAVRSELRQIVGLQSAPLEYHVSRWPRAFPQYVTGHLARAARIEEMTATLMPLALAGAGYHGIGIPACVQSGLQAAAAIRTVLEHD